MTPGGAPIRTIVEQNAGAGRAWSRGDDAWAIGLGAALVLAAAAWVVARRWCHAGWGAGWGWAGPWGIAPAERAFRILIRRLGLDIHAERALRDLARGAGCAPVALLVCPEALAELGERAVRRGERIDGVLLGRLVRVARVARGDVASSVGRANAAPRPAGQPTPAASP